MANSSRVHQSAFSAAKTALKLKASDSPTAALALRYAQMLDMVRDSADETREIARIGPLYLAALRELGMTPSARAALLKLKDQPADGEAPLSKLAQARKERDELGIRRAARKTS